MLASKLWDSLHTKTDTRDRIEHPPVVSHHLCTMLLTLSSTPDRQHNTTVAGHLPLVCNIQAPLACPQPAAKGRRQTRAQPPRNKPWRLRYRRHAAWEGHLWALTQPRICVQSFFASLCGDCSLMRWPCEASRPELPRACLQGLKRAPGEKSDAFLTSGHHASRQWHLGWSPSVVRQGALVPNTGLMANHAVYVRQRRRLVRRCRSEGRERHIKAVAHTPPFALLGSYPI